MRRGKETDKILSCCNSRNSISFIDGPLVSFPLMPFLNYVFDVPRCTLASWSRGIKKRKKKIKNKKREEYKSVKQRKKKNEKNIMRSRKPCRSPFVRGHASYWFSLMYLSYMAVCLTNLMVFFPLPESWMAVTPATLAIFWSQYGNGNRQP